MRDLAGVLFLLLAAGLFQAALRRRSAAPAEGGAAAAVGAFRGTFGARVRAFIFALLVYAGLKALAAYFLLALDRYVSLLDIGGFICLLAAYAFWLQVKLRRPAQAPAAAPVRASAQPAR
jgi:hypothetical protein